MPNYNLWLPRDGAWEMILNTDDADLVLDGTHLRVDVSSPRAEKPQAENPQATA